MAFTERTRPYETLIRHADDGSVAAHHQRISEVLRDGAVVAATVQPPVPVGDAELGAVLGEALDAALSELDRLHARVAALERQIAENAE